jgi:uncharacterized protein YaiE (UPF0345 family)
MIADVSPVVIPYPDELELVPGDYIKSPSGVYYATLLKDGQFVVSQGTNPTISGLHPVWETPAVTNAVNPAIGFAGGAAIIYSRTEPDIYDGFGNFSNPEDGTVVSLADNGTLTVDSGTKPGHPVQQTFSNNVDDPVVKYDLTGVTYDLAHPTIESSSLIASEVFNGKNGSSEKQVFPGSLTIKYVKTSSWSFSLSEAISISAKTKFDVGLPGLGDTESELSFTSTTTVGKILAGTESEEKDYVAGVSLTVPAHSYYQAVMTATRETFDIPFTYTGDAVYKDGATVPVDGSGTFAGTDTGVFEVDVKCISEPGGCRAPTTLSFPAAVPEPSTWAMMSGGALVLAAFRGLLARGARARGRRETPSVA